MASSNSASIDGASPADFGRWLRQQREAKELRQRQVAAAAEMDQSHYAKIEAGKKFPRSVQADAIIRCLALDAPDFRQRQKAAEFIANCDGDLEIAAGAASRVQEHAAPYVVNNPAKKLRIKK